MVPFSLVNKKEIPYLLIGEMKLLYMLRRFCNQRVVNVYYPVTEAGRSKVEKNIVEVQ